MKVTNFGPGSLPLSTSGWSTGATSVNSNFNTTDGGLSALNFVQAVTVDGSGPLLRPIVNVASGSNITLTIDKGPGGSTPSNTVRIHATGGGTVSAGSNSTRVSEDSSIGASTTLWSPFDHRHDGIGTITSSSSNTMQRGTWNVRAGSGIALALSDSDGDGEFDTTTIVNTGSASGGGGGTAVDNWLIDVWPVMGSHGNTNWSGSRISDAAYYAGYDTESSGTQNDEIYWDLGISGGTWDFQLVHDAGPNRGIYTVSIDGVSVGTVDGYNASAAGAAKFTFSTITGISITAGKRRLKLKMATKNASSSGFFGTIQQIELRRTA